MKKITFKKEIFTFVTVIALSLFAAILPAVCIRLVPLAISYEKQPSQTKAVTLTVRPFADESEGCLFKALSDIPDLTSYKVQSKDEQIYVYGENECLYRVNADLSHFPDGDKAAIRNGISAHTRQELFEIVSYMES